MTATQNLPSIKYPHLAKPLELGAIKSRNRNLMASLTRNRAGSAEEADNTVPGQDNFDYYVQRAKGGCGVILTEGTLITRQGTEWKNVAGLWNDEQAAAWKKIVDAVHAEGAAIVLQAWHVGRIARAETYEGKKSGKPVYAPSAIAARGGKFRELDNAPHATPTAVEDPNEIIEQYRNTARLAKQVGFDGVELHSANGYLVHQFLDYTSNKRTDQWGGSVENRCRFGLAALDALISEMGADRVGLKINPCAGYNDVGMKLEDQIETYKYYIGEIEKRKVAYIQLVRYVDVMDPEYEPGVKRAVKHDVTATYPPLIKHAKVLLNGQFDAEEAEKTIASGVADGIVFGVPWIGNPDLYERQQLGLELNQPNPKTFYATPEGEPNWIGYTDYEFSKETPSGKSASPPEHVRAVL